MNGQETKSPFYKTFWFYVIVIPLFLYVIGKYPLENNKPSKNTSNESASTRARNEICNIFNSSLVLDCFILSQNQPLFSRGQSL
jgi:hypothetical protein